MLGAFMDRMNEPGSAVSEPVTAPTTEPAPTAEPPVTFEAFFQAEHARLLRALFLVTGNEQEAEELMQDAFLAVWERWDRVREMERPTGYLYRTAMNAFRSRVRRAARAAKRLVGCAEEDEFARADQRDAVARGLGTLTPRQRAALVLTELLGYGSEEAGEILGVKAVTVRVLASQGRTAMKEKLERSDG
jgi:RNA polymerase sigma factor (sigma-70 family)